MSTNLINNLVSLLGITSNGLKVRKDKREKFPFLITSEDITAANDLVISGKFINSYFGDDSDIVKKPDDIIFTIRLGDDIVTSVISKEEIENSLTKALSKYVSITKQAQKQTKPTDKKSSKPTKHSSKKTL